MYWIAELFEFDISCVLKACGMVTIKSENVEKTLPNISTELSMMGLNVQSELLTMSSSYAT